MSRPKTPLDLSDELALCRIATLAASVMCTLRKPGHGPYESERQLKSWLVEDGITFTTADIAPSNDQNLWMVLGLVT